jgi:hypothetical protein
MRSSSLNIINCGGIREDFGFIPAANWLFVFDPSALGDRRHNNQNENKFHLNNFYLFGHLAFFSSDGPAEGTSSPRRARTHAVCDVNCILLRRSRPRIRFRDRSS